MQLKRTHFYAEETRDFLHTECQCAAVFTNTSTQPSAPDLGRGCPRPLVLQSFWKPTNLHWRSKSFTYFSLWKSRNTLLTSYEKYGSFLFSPVTEKDEICTTQLSSLYSQYYQNDIRVYQIVQGKWNQKEKLILVQKSCETHTQCFHSMHFSWTFWRTHVYITKHNVIMKTFGFFFFKCLHYICD